MIAVTTALMGGVAVTGSSAVAASPQTISGRLETVAAAAVPDGGWTGWRVDLVRSDTNTEVDNANVAADGSFTLSPPAEGPDEALTYILASAPQHPDHPRDRTAVLAVVVPASEHTVVVNERTTVATAWAAAQFITPEGIIGTAPGLPNAAAMSRNLADPRTGTTAATLLEAPNGNRTSALATFNSLTAALAACVAQPFANLDRYPRGACEDILRIAADRDPSGSGDTFRAFAAIARTPSGDTQGLFYLSRTVTLAGDAPVLKRAPVAWMLPLRFHGDGQSLSGPGNFVVDHEGNIWISSNYQYAADPTTPVCGSELLFRSSPTGALQQFSGGGLSGAGWGIARDTRSGNIWVANYGFAAPEPGCPADEQPPHNSVSLFDRAGTALSGPDGFTAGGLAWPQGTVVTHDRSVWFANCNTGTLTTYPGGDPIHARVIPAGELQLQQPFGIVDNGSALFISGIANNAVGMVSYDGTVLPQSPGPRSALDRPLGVTASADGTVWVANSGVITLPCPDRPASAAQDQEAFEAILQSATFDDQGRWTGEGANPYQGSVARVRPDGSAVTGYTGGGVTVPWGITTDGDGNVWVANFAGRRLSLFCGTDPTTCPAGLDAGDPISPDETGFYFDGLVRNTGVIVDQAGNVWVANNWEEVPLQTNPGGHEIVAFLGMAAPVDVSDPDPAPTPTPTPTESSPAPMSGGTLPATGVTGTEVMFPAFIGLAVVAAGAALIGVQQRRLARRRPLRARRIWRTPSGG